MHLVSQLRSDQSKFTILLGDPGQKQWGWGGGGAREGVYTAAHCCQPAHEALRALSDVSTISLSPLPSPLFLPICHPLSKLPFLLYSLRTSLLSLFLFYPSLSQVLSIFSFSVLTNPPALSLSPTSTFLSLRPKPNPNPNPTTHTHTHLLLCMLGPLTNFSLHCCPKKRNNSSLPSS